jgi:antitoxin component YwqK of YwqJK toxin-antitoxin module
MDFVGFIQASTSRFCGHGVSGPATMFYESGAKMNEANYRAGLLDGKSLSYYESGAKKAAAEYKDGVLHGISISCSEDGREQSRSIFINSLLQAEK